MTNFNKACRCLCWGTWMLLFISFVTFSHSAAAQCNFINNITGLSLSTQPAGDAANPALYTQTYVLVDNQGNIYATGPTPNFMGVPAGNYSLYAINYDNNETFAIAPLLAAGAPWSGIKNYGDNSNNCLDYTDRYSGCPIVVCNQVTICEFDVLTQTANGFTVADHTQTYCLVCAGVVRAISSTGSFDLAAIPAATAGASCQTFALNYLTASGNPVTVGSNWSTATAGLCTGACFDFVGTNLLLNPISLASGNGISTTTDWWNTSDGCAGATTSTNGGGPFDVPANNWCVPPYNQGTIRPLIAEADDLYLMSVGQLSRFACNGSLDLTQHTVFYTVLCDPSGPSILEVNIINPGANITGLQAALYGPVNAACPVITGGTFVDCDDSGVGATSGAPLGDLTLTTNGNPGETYLVIIDTEGRDSFRITSNTILLDTDLKSFTGIKQREDNLLSWTTEKEDGLKHFELERSIDGYQFEPLATVLATGYSQSPIDYSYYDSYPGAGNKYYRLKLVQDDGAISYSNIVVLSRDKSNNLSMVSVSPNPSNGNFQVIFSADAESTLHYELLDMVGRTVLESFSPAVAGMNTLKLELHDLPAATYILSMNMDGYRVNRRIVVAE